MTNSKISAVNWLVEKLNQCEPWYSGLDEPLAVHIHDLIRNAREIERHQIADAFRAGTTSSFNTGYDPPEEYYEKNFRKK
jgi:hypothetical protein